MADVSHSEAQTAHSSAEPQSHSRWDFLSRFKEKAIAPFRRHHSQASIPTISTAEGADLGKPAEPDQPAAAREPTTSQDTEPAKQPEERFKDQGVLSSTLSRSAWPGPVAERLSLADITGACNSLSLPYAQAAEGVVINFGIEPRVAGKPEERYVVDAQGRLIQTDSVFTEDYTDDYFKKHQMKGKILRTELEYDERGLAVGRTAMTVDSNGQQDVLSRDHYVYREGRPLEEYDIEHEAKNRGGMDKYTETYEARLARAKGSYADR